MTAPQENTDEELLELIAGQRNARAFSVLYDRWSARMYRYFLRMNRRQADKAADMTQDLFLKMIEKGHLFDPTRKFSTWIYSIAANMCKNEFRRKNLFEQVADYPDCPGDMDDEFLNASLDRATLEQYIQTAVDRLDEPQRQCFILRWQEELSVKEISEIMDCPEGTVKSRLHYALQQVSGKVKQQTGYDY